MCLSTKLILRKNDVSCGELKVASSVIDTQYQSSLDKLPTMAAPHIRYQFKPFVGSNHWWVLRQLTQLPVSTRVLDVGSGSGAIGQALKMQGVTNLYAVEVDAEAREHVKDIYEEVASDISEFSGRTFDLILLLDVLEHVTDPQTLFSDAMKTLAPGGKVLISLPNVAHWSVRIPLLFGVFDYYDRGIMDRTHYQFFTRKRVRQFLRSGPPLKKCVFSSSIEPVELLLPKALWDNPLFEAISKIRLAIAWALPGFFAYQHLILAERE